MSLDDDQDCPGHEWVVHELRGTRQGMERDERCTACGAVRYVPAQAAVRDARPPLDG